MRIMLISHSVLTISLFVITKHRHHLNLPDWTLLLSERKILPATLPARCSILDTRTFYCATRTFEDIIRHTYIIIG